MKVYIGRYPKNDDERTVRVRIDRHDLWSLDSTLAYIILPALIQLREIKHGYPRTDVDDAPHLPDDTDGGGAGPGFSSDRWNYIMDEMIWAFTQINTDWERQFHSAEIDWQFEAADPESDVGRMVTGPNHTAKFDKEGYKVFSDRIDNGLRLFGKYYRSLWD